MVGSHDPAIEQILIQNRISGYIVLNGRLIGCFLLPKWGEGMILL
jgi:hypothetical protein